MTSRMQALWQTFFQEEEEEEEQEHEQECELPSPSSSKRARIDSKAPNPLQVSSNVAALAPLAPKPFVLSTTTVAATQRQHRTEHRKRKNAEYARVTRERKRNAELLLNLELASLERENERLKQLVRSNLTPEQAQTVISECCYTRNTAAQLFFPATKEDETNTNLLRSDFELIESLTKSRQAFCITDPRLPDNPIVYASRPFLALTGYGRDQLLGRNCRILQGIDTDPAAVNEIRQAVAEGKDGAACLLNYKADGTPFWNQFFVAPLRNNKHGKVVNYVGVQHQIDKPEPVPTSKKISSSDSMEVDGTSTEDSKKQPPPIFTPPVQDTSRSKQSNSNMFERGDSTDIMKDEGVDMVDWAELANALEHDMADFDSLGEASLEVIHGHGKESNTFDTTILGDTATQGETEEEELASKTNNDMPSRGGDTSSSSNETNDAKLTYLEQFFTSPPKEFVVRTVRSELIDVLISNGGDVTDNRFLQGLNVLSELFRSSIKFNTSLSEVLNGSWKSISRPMYHYGGCVGMNEQGDFVYTLGKMCFNMFKPGMVRVTVQNTMNHIEPVCRMDQLPSAAPWSLRRELCLTDPNTLQTSNILKSYDVVVALTIEPGHFAAAKGKFVPSPVRRLKALQVARGFFLPDPDTPNRLTVWFTGGDLAPAPLTDEDLKKGYGGLDDWVEFFGAEYKRTWSEALSDMGAKLFLGAELPNEMDPNGKLEYTLHRPFGGHGKGHADVMYVDGDLLITKGQSGSVHVMVAQK